MFDLSSLRQYMGMKVITSPYALEETDIRLFPKSRYRSSRLHKKLVKRYGGEFKKVPCFYESGNDIIVHPNLYHKLLKGLTE